jgi:aspartyl protease family protein
MWHLALIGSGLLTTLLGAAAIGAASPDKIVAMNAQAGPALPGNVDTARAIERGADGLFYVAAQTPSGQARLLVDTGASHVVLSHTDARKLGARLQSGKHSTISTAAGTINADWVVIEKLEINGHILKGVQAAVPRNDVQTSLLGQNALAQFSEIRIQGDQMSLLR